MNNHHKTGSQKSGSIRQYFSSIKNWEELLGWILLVGSSFTLLFNDVTNFWELLLLTISLTIGFYVVVRQEGWLGLSDSTKHLLTEARAGKASRSHILHHLSRVSVFWKPKTKFKHKDYFIVGLILALASAISYLILVSLAGTDWQAGFMLLLALIALVLCEMRSNNRRHTYGLVVLIYLVLGLTKSADFNVSMTLLLSMLGMAYAWRKEDWSLLTMIVIGTYTSYLRWLLYYFGINNVDIGLGLVSWVSTWFVINVGVILTSVVAVLPFIGKKRDLEYSKTIKTLFIVNFGGLALTMIALFKPLISVGALASYSISLAAISAALGYVAYMAHGRLSYAKYYYFTALLMILLVGILRFDLILLNGWFLAFGVIVLLTGFIKNSYSARMVGMGLLGYVIAHYLMWVLPIASQTTNTEFTVGTFWLGMLILTYMFLVSYWYKGIVLGMAEYRLKSKIVLGLQITAALFAFIMTVCLLSWVYFIVIWLVILFTLMFFRAYEAYIQIKPKKAWF